MGLDRSSDPQVFADLGLAPEQRLACFLYGGQPPGRWALRAECLPPGWACVVCAGGDPPGDALTLCPAWMGLSKAKSCSVRCAITPW